MLVKNGNGVAWSGASLIIVVVIATMGYSTHLNWRYGLDFFGGEGQMDARVFAAGFALLDCGKYIVAALVPVFWSMRKGWTAAFLVVLFLLGSALSVTAMFSVGVQGAENSLGKTRAKRQNLDEMRARRDDLKRQIQELGTTVPPSVIEHHMQALRRDRRWQSTVGCTDVTAAASRIFCADHDRLFAQIAAATKSERLQVEVEKLNQEIRSLTDAETVVDKRRLMSIVAAWLDLKADEVGAVQLFVFAIAVELYGGVLSAVAAGHVASLLGGSAQRVVSPGTGAVAAPARVRKRRGGKLARRPRARPRARREGESSPAGRDSGDAAGGNVVRARAATGDAQAPAAEHPLGTQGTAAGAPAGIATSVVGMAVLNGGPDDACPLDFWDEVIVSAPGARIGACELYEGYQAWSRRRGTNPLPQTSFGKALTSARGAQRLKSNGRILYVDVALVLPCGGTVGRDTTSTVRA